MATVALTSVWLSDALNPSDGIAVRASQLSDKPVMAGQVRVYASGRTRAVALGSTSRQLAVTLDLETQATVDWLEAKLGQLVYLRDPSGSIARYGVFYAFQRDPYIFPVKAKITFTLEEVTYSEAV